MNLCKDQFARLARNDGLFQKEKIRVRVLGDLSLLPDEVSTSLRKTEEITRNNDEAILNVCICYNSKDEINEATQRIGQTRPEEQVFQFEQHLCGGYNVKPELMIRTSDEVRLSNFMLYQSDET